MGKQNEQVWYWRGKHATIPSDIITGRLLVEEDTGDVFLDFRDYIDGELKRIQLTDNRKANRSGDTFTGPVILSRDPQELLEAATKQYVDNVSDKLSEHVDNTDIHITSEERNKWNNKVDKEDGKGLSTNDFTDQLKTKLEGIADNATKVEVETTYKPSEEDVPKYYNIGTITVNDVEYIIYSPIPENVSGNAATATKLATKRSIDGVNFDGTKDIKHFGSVVEESTVQAKTCEIEDYVCVDGGQILLYFSSGNTAENATLNISNTGAFPIFYQGAPVATDLIDAGYYQLVCRDNSASGTAFRYEVVSSVAPEYESATEDDPGLMTPEMVKKLNGIEDGANKYILIPATAATLGGVIIGDNITVDASGKISISAEDVTGALGYTPIQAYTQEELKQLIGDMVGATEDTDGIRGLVPAPTAGDQNKYLSGSGNWEAPDVPEPIDNDTIKKMLESWGWGPGQTIAGATNWSELKEKPFESIGSGLSVTDNILTVVPMSDETINNCFDAVFSTN